MYRVKKSCKMQFEQEKSNETQKYRTQIERTLNMWAERADTCCLRDFPTALEYGSAKYEAKYLYTKV